MAISWALITGASTGIGRALTTQLADAGFRVIAGIRSPEAADKLLRSAGQRLQIVPLNLDVTEQRDIDKALERAAELSGENGLRAVINNAGVVVPGPMEFVPAAEWRRQFDINFFGMIEVSRAALPLLRKGVQAHGRFVPRLVFTSSIGGRISQPILSPYTASKFATTALGDALRLELRRQGIGVTVVEPGAVATEIWGKAEVSGSQFGAGHPARELYSTEIDGVVAASQKISTRAISPERAAHPIVRSILAPRPAARVLVGRDAKIMATMQGLLPRAWFDELLAREFNLNGRQAANASAPGLPLAAGKS